MPSTPLDPPPTERAPGLQVEAFRALTYAQFDPAHLSRVTSPAYDLVTPQGRRRLAAADPHNVVRLILPEPDGPARAPDMADTAAQAAATLLEWRAAGVLHDDPDPALWLYQMHSPGGAVTTGWLAAVAIPPVGSGEIVPHEDTYPPAVEGRRELLAATATDLEPIVLAHDRDDEVARLSAAAAIRPPDVAVADPDGVRHSLWRVGDPATIAGLVAGWSHTGAVIADGHHRFAAARAHAASRAAGSGSVLALLTATGPGGLRVQAIHRVVPDLDLVTATGLAAADFDIDDMEVDRPNLPAALRDWVDQPGHGVFLLTDGRRAVQLSAPSEAVRARVPADAPPRWRSLDVVLAHHGIVAGLWGRPDDPEHVLVAHDPDEARKLASARSGVALLLRSPTPADVASVARAGSRMPRKSTLFVPKPRTGLVMRPLVGPP